MTDLSEKNPIPGKSDKLWGEWIQSGHCNKSSQGKTRNQDEPTRHKEMSLTHETNHNKKNSKCTNKAREAPSGLVGPKRRLVTSKSAPPLLGPEAAPIWQYISESPVELSGRNWERRPNQETEWHPVTKPRENPDWGWKTKTGRKCRRVSWKAEYWAGWQKQSTIAEMLESATLDKKGRCAEY
jgi:hypothetical protein